MSTRTHPDRPIETDLNSRLLSLRGMVILVALLAMILAYGTSYHRLSRRGMSEAPDYGLEGFLYVPVAEAVATEDLSRHYVLMVFYTPANRIDRLVLGGPAPVQSILWRLSG